MLSVLSTDLLVFDSYSGTPCSLCNHSTKQTRKFRQTNPDSFSVRFSKDYNSLLIQIFDNNVFAFCFPNTQYTLSGQNPIINNNQQHLHCRWYQCIYFEQLLEFNLVKNDNGCKVHLGPGHAFHNLPVRQQRPPITTLPPHHPSTLFT